MSEKVKIDFFGASGTVTGSKFLLSVLDKKILIDCGMFQGLKKLRLENWNELPIDAKSIDLVLLTHGHLDHCGFLPRLVKAGFKGDIMATSPTLEIAEIILKDSARIHEEDAEKANREGYSKHKKAEPFYDMEEAEKAIKLFQNQSEGEWINLFHNIKVRFNYVGHILGATFLELDVNGTIFVFSGDIGRKNDLLLRDPKKPTKADYLFIESTYGDRIHPQGSEKQFLDIIKKTIDRQGTVIIPSFAVERTQNIMYLLWQFYEKNQIKNVPIYLDSPMGTHVLDIFNKHTDWHKLSTKEITEICSKIKVVKSLKQSFKLAEDPEPKIIIAGSGMASGGRVLTYFQSCFSDKKSTIIFVGYQAEGTRGRQLIDGAKEIKIQGKYYQVRTEIANIQGLSAHADQNELLDWLSEIKNTPQKVFIVHGEPQSADVLRRKIKDTYNWDCMVPSLFDIYEN
jgi:metallo-beta-lactamase family protein